MSKVYIAGAGPGHPRLMTLETMNLISKVDVILVDELVGPEILRLCRESQKELILVGKRGGQAHSFPQEEIERRMIELSKEGKRILRLKGGCPSIFARTFEETEILSRHDIPYEIIPGVTAMSAASCFGELPLTKRGTRNQLVVLSGHSAQELPELKYSPSSTLVFYMGVHNIQEIAKHLLCCQWPKDSILTVVSNASLYNQKKHEASLEEWSAFTGEIPKPALILLQKAQKEKGWYQEKKRVLFTGTREGNDLFPEAELVHRPMMTTSLKARSLPDLGSFSHLLFMSKHSVNYFFEILRAQGKDLRSLSKLSLVAIGKLTAKELIEKEKVFLRPHEIFESGELFCQKVSPESRCLILRSQLEKDFFAESLSQKCSQVEVFDLYQLAPSNDQEPIEFDAIDEIYFTAPLGARHFFSLYRVPERVVLKAVGDVTQKVIESFKRLL